MADSWMYDGFPLRRADSVTSGADYKYVIQSIDAAIRHLFGIPVGVSLEPAFSISEDGKVSILQSLTIGTSTEVTEVIAEIQDTSQPEEVSQLATVAALRSFIAEEVEDITIALDLWVAKAGDTMSGQLVAGGGINMGASQEITGDISINADSDIVLDSSGGGAVLSALDLKMGLNKSLQGWDGSSYYDLIKLVGSTVNIGNDLQSCRLYGVDPRPMWNDSESIALVSDLEAVGAGGYVPIAGGSFTGNVNFTAGLQLPANQKIRLEDGGSTPHDVFLMDNFGAVEASTGSPTQRFKIVGAPLQVDATYGIYIGTDNLATIPATDLELGSYSHPLNLVGSGTRPKFKGADLALFSEAGDTVQAGDGIEVNDLGGGVHEVGLLDSGIDRIKINALGAAAYKVLALDGASNFTWEMKINEVIAGTGLTGGGTSGDVTVSIAALGVDTAQIAADAVDDTKIADDVVGVDHLNASTIGLTGGVSYFLANTDSVLTWENQASVGALSVAEYFKTSLNTTSTTYVTMVNLTNGPYILHRVIDNNNHTTEDGLIRIYIDGSEVFTDLNAESGFADIIGPAADIYQMPLFAATSIQIDAKRSIVGGITTFKAESIITRMT